MTILLLNMEKVVRIVDLFRYIIIKNGSKITLFSKAIACFIPQQSFYPCVVRMLSSKEYYFVYSFSHMYC